MKTLMIAIQSQIMTDIFSEHFRKEYEVHTCIEGNEALRLLQELKPDILIIDLSLPHITGLSVLQQTCYTPPAIISLTDYLSDDIVHEVQQAGVGALIRIPCTIECIASNINRLQNK